MIMKKTYSPVAIALAATSGSLLFGFDISSVSAFLDNKDYLEYFNHPDSVLQGGITAAMAGGSFVGSLASGHLSDMFGRRMVLLLSSLIWIVGAAIQCSSQNVAQLIIGRLISGVAIGLESGQAPVYIAEISPAKYRGSLGSLFQWAVTWGIMINFFICYGCTFIDGPSSFRAGWGIQMVPGLLFMLLVGILPESPRWLAAHHREDKALDIIAKVNAKGDKTAKIVTDEFDAIIDAIRLERKFAKTSIWDLFKRHNIVRTMVGITSQMWQQLSGMNILMYYIVYIFTMAGYTGNTNLVSSSIQFVLNVIMTVPPLIWLDKWGRRPVLLIGALLCTIWLFAIGGVMHSYGHYTEEFANKNIRWTVSDPSKAKCVIAFSFLFVASFAPTWGPTVWVYCSEIFPMSQRARAMGICAATNWIFNFALAFFVPVALRNIQWKTYMIFGAFMASAFIEVFFLFPETRGRTLEEIDELWSSGIPAWKTYSVKKSDLHGLHNTIYVSEKKAEKIISSDTTSTSV